MMKRKFHGNEEYILFHFLHFVPLGMMRKIVSMGIEEVKINMFLQYLPKTEIFYSTSQKVFHR